MIPASIFANGASRRSARTCLLGRCNCGSPSEDTGQNDRNQCSLHAIPFNDEALRLRQKRHRNWCHREARPRNKPCHPCKYQFRRCEKRGLTPRSSGAPTAGHQARSGGTRYILASPGLAPCRCRPLSSNVRPHKHASAALLHGMYRVRTLATCSSSSGTRRRRREICASTA